jgi:hypothetical protein
MFLSYCLSVYKTQNCSDTVHKESVPLTACVLVSDWNTVSTRTQRMTPAGWISLIVTNSDEKDHCPVANSHSVSKEISRLLLNPKIPYRVHMNSTLVSVATQSIQYTSCLSISLRLILILCSYLDLSFPNTLFPLELPNLVGMECYFTEDKQGWRMKLKRL